MKAGFASWPGVKIFSLLTITGLIGISLWARTRLPDALIATHFGPGGVTDGFMPRDEALMAGPMLAVMLTLVLWLLPYFQPKNGKVERSARIYGVAWMLTLAVVAAAHLFIVGKALGMTANVQGLTLLPGVLFIVLGNFLPKTRFNYIIGVRTPWTLSNERVWDRTHRLAGPVFMLTGLVMLIGAWMMPVDYQHTVILTGALGSTLILTIASYVFARQNRTV
ncbi:SdpI family protein [Asticcacaulis sp. BYS171W]|uniref:SdpI family protein n=1 Tax=Asticcacaulis aquaticus TaxID=2984212 RepID=A0ABT5HRB1_9CAUL|nr:SdpI family protein [Asticcacaulis aquaticus]MDC7682607.1 SdpI family protein [Asticcacaulis aquaticus]